MRSLSVFFIILTLLMQYTLWFGGGSSVPDLVRIKKTVEMQKEKNKNLQMRNRVLEAEVCNLKAGHAAIEERARADLGLVKDDEIYYQVENKV